LIGYRNIIKYVIISTG